MRPNLPSSGRHAAGFAGFRAPLTSIGRHDKRRPRMTHDGNKPTRRGPGDKRIEFAASDRVDDMRRIADEFMMEIFDFLPGEYLITDEVDHSRFHGIRIVRHLGNLGPHQSGLLG